MVPLTLSLDAYSKKQIQNQSRIKKIVEENTVDKRTVDDSKRSLNTIKKFHSAFGAEFFLK